MGIIGCGFIGSIRASNVADDNDSFLVVAADREKSRAESVANPAGAKASSDWEEAVNHPEVQAVVIATAHDSLAPLSIAALRAGTHVLCEKPMSLDSRQAEEVVSAAAESGSKFMVGFNHR